MKLDISILSDTDLRDVGDFDCGVENEPLTAYLKGDAFEENANGKTKTYVVRNVDNNDIIGYFSLRTSGIGYVDEFKKVKSVPAVELSEYALDVKYQGNGLGSDIFLGHIVPKVQNLSSNFGCQIILVYAFHQKSIEFYEKNNFKEIENMKEFITIVDDFSQGCRVFVYTL